jgi:hypothetical protein
VDISESVTQAIAACAKAVAFDHEMGMNTTGNSGEGKLNDKVQKNGEAQNV